MKPIFFWRGFAVGAVCFILVGLLFVLRFLKSPDDPFTQIPLQTTVGQKIDATEFDGKPLIVNYWATWCAPCLKEFPLFDSIRKQYNGKIEFLMISDESLEKINQFAESKPYGFTYLKSEENLSTFGIHVRPMTFFYNAKGTLITQHMGEIDREGFINTVRTIE